MAMARIAAMNNKVYDLKPIEAMYADVTGPRTGPDLSKVHTECLNINECAIDDLNTCGLNGNCIGTVSKPEPLVRKPYYKIYCVFERDDFDRMKDTVGSYHCVCALGYEGDLICRDIDECLDNTHECDSLSTCRNTVGTYKCDCINGFESIGDTVGVTGGGVDALGVGSDGTVGVQCVDTNECTLPTPPCDGNQWYCTNTKGSYECTCHLGFTKRGENCEDIDECSEGDIIFYSNIFSM